MNYTFLLEVDVEDFYEVNPEHLQTDIKVAIENELGVVVEKIERQVEK